MGCKVQKRTIPQVFADPCDVAIGQGLLFPEGTASVKFLLTDADPDEVSYMAGAPTYQARIDPEGETGSAGVDDREDRPLRLLQVDIAVRDAQAPGPGWVFGTFAWMGPATGDELFDNLVPVSLMWGNDAGVVDAAITQSWINPQLEGQLFGWDERPFLGFNGRANGPADNLISFCQSCHAAARTPRAQIGIAGGFGMAQIGDPAAVAAHVARWFEDVPAGALFEPQEAGVPLDYSLQVEAAVYRMCLACLDVALTGSTSNICLDARFVEETTCEAPRAAPSAEEGELRRLANVPPRQ